MKIAKLFQNGQSQAVRLPKEFRFEGQEVFIKKVGSAIIMFPIENPWGSLVNSLSKFSSDFMEARNQPKQQDRDDLFS
ncbi:MAG: type II toxin-antitoxin system VapB family antitoxin [Gammaproteobacteria bacterium]|nr:type II toxin-antitoxin system VapB family antitoxin [Gammaproteobacteria bacterium]